MAVTCNNQRNSRHKRHAFGCGFCIPDFCNLSRRDRNLKGGKMSCFSPTKEQDRDNDLKMISFHKFFQAQVLAGKVTVL
jgi:hypothetical protein